MNSNHRRLLLATFLFSLVFVSGAAASSHHFIWGASFDDRFDYVFYLKDQVIDENMYVIVDDIPILPEQVNELGDIPGISTDEFWENGTPTFYWDSVFPDWPIMPIGNWSYIKQLLIDSTLDITEWIETECLFGYTFTQSPSNFHTIIYWKIDGVLYQYIGNSGLTLQLNLTRTDVTSCDPSTITTEESISSSTTMTTSPTTTASTTTPGLDISTVMIVVGTGIIIVLVIVVLMKKR
ncbi:MAG: hypothetical protein ACXAEF_13200 [Candidatus Thorarchaeota archaeon]|jgi:hypothetical protein